MNLNYGLSRFLTGKPQNASISPQASIILNMIAMSLEATQSNSVWTSLAPVHMTNTNTQYCRV